MIPERPDLSPKTGSALKFSFGDENIEMFLETTWQKLVPEARPITTFSYDPADGEIKGEAVKAPVDWSRLVQFMQIHYMKVHDIPSRYYAETGFSEILQFIVATGRDLLAGKNPDLEVCAESYSKLDPELRDGWVPVVQDIAVASEDDLPDLVQVFRDASSELTFGLFKGIQNKKSYHDHDAVEDANTAAVDLEIALLKQPGKEKQDYLSYWAPFHGAMFDLCDATIQMIRSRTEQLRHENEMIAAINATNHLFIQNILPCLAERNLMSHFDQADDQPGSLKFFTSPRLGLCHGHSAP